LPLVGGVKNLTNKQLSGNGLDGSPVSLPVERLPDCMSKEKQLSSSWLSSYLP
jgi:hypothetical protein